MSEKSFSTAEFLEVKMNSRLKENSAILEDFFCVFQFEIGSGIWNLDFTGQEKQIKSGAHSEPDCVIRMSDENFEKLLKKQLNIPMALISGKIKIQGDKSLALKLGDLFK